VAERTRVLILGGTQDGAAIAQALAAEPEIHTVSSLAGRTRNPASIAGEVRSGGFGGADGLARYLMEARIDLLVDATHPFAAAISRHAAAASEAARVPRVQLQRPPWTAEDGDRWVEVENARAAARETAAQGSRAFLTVGRQELAAFAAYRDVWFLIRLIDPPAEPVGIPAHELICGRGPFEAAAEEALMRKHGIEVLISKNSGGRPTYGKIEAARRIGIPVVMIRPPPPQSGERVDSVDAACAWIRKHLAAR
jgi:precorrin-6A/cobalt-precorrin-6A reductase